MHGQQNIKTASVVQVMIFVGHYGAQDRKLISTSQKNVILPCSGRQFVLVVVILSLSLSWKY